MTSLYSIFQMTGWVYSQRGILAQSGDTLEYEQDALHATQLAGRDADLQKNRQTTVVTACRNAVHEAKTPLDLALHSLALESAKQTSLDANASIVGDRIWGPHYAFEDACQDFSTQEVCLCTLEANPMSEMANFRRLDSA